MEKISSQKVAAVMATIPGVLRSLAKERDELLEKNAALQSKVVDYERRARVDGLAKMASDKHLDSLGETHEEKIATIETAIEQGKSLDVMEEAVKMSAAHMSLGEVSGDEISAGGGDSQLEAYLRGEID